jgi:hypothetical protein
MLAAASSCRPPDRPAAGPSRDSAGISIIESTAPIWSAGKGRTVVDSPVIDLGGGTDPHSSFGSISNVLRLSDGRIVVGEQTPTTLRYFSRDGQWLYDVGAADDGAGELRSIFHLALGRNDTVAVYDLARRQLVLFDPNGALAATVPVAETLTPQGTNGYLPKGFAPDGRYLLQRDEVAFPFAGTSNSVIPDSTRIFWLSRAGALTDSTPRLRVGEIFGFPLTDAQGKQLTVPLARPLAPILHLAAGVDRIWMGDGSTWELRGFDGNGTLTTILRRPGERPLFTPAMRETFIAQYRARALIHGAGAMQQRFAAGMGRAPFPDRLPAFGDLLSGTDSTLWVDRTSPVDAGASQAGQIWTLFDPAGRWLGDVTMPPRFRLAAAGHDWVLGVWLDDHAVEHVRLYSLVER